MPTKALPSTASQNIKAIAEVEQQLLGRRSSVERIGEKITRFFGSMSFIVAHAVFILAWLVLNLSVFPTALRFDPYPYPFLGLIVGVEFIFLTTFVLMNQKYHSQHQDQWSHLNLQVCMLTEQEVTKNMQMLHQICKHLKISESSTDQEVKELARATPVTALVEQIEIHRELEAKIIEQADDVARAN